MAGPHTQKAVFIVYDHCNCSEPSNTQKETQQLVDQLFNKYRSRCNIKRYMEDYRPGASIFNEHKRLMGISNIICVIVTREASKMFRLENQSCLVNITENDKRFVIIGVGIKEGDLTDQMKTKRYALYKSFGEVNVEENSFLDRIFLPDSPREETNSSLPPESSGEVTNSSSFQESSGEVTNSSSSQESPGEKTSSSSSPGFGTRAKDVFTYLVRNRPLRVVLGTMSLIFICKLADLGFIAETSVGVIEIILKWYLPSPFHEISDHIRKHNDSSN